MPGKGGTQMKKRGFSRREFLQVGAGAAAGLMTASIIGCSGGGGGGGGPDESGPTVFGTLKEGLYRGHRSITAAYQPTDSALYRQLLPNAFQMPDSLQVVVSMLSYHNVTTPLVP